MRGRLALVFGDGRAGGGVIAGAGTGAGGCWVLHDAASITLINISALP